MLDLPAPHDGRPRSHPLSGGPVLLFDAGQPGCDTLIEFVAARDGGRFTFVPLASAYGQQLAAGLPPEAGPVALVEGGRVSVRSEAILRACRHLRRGWPLAALGLALPRELADGLLGRWWGDWASPPPRREETLHGRGRP